MIKRGQEYFRKRKEEKERQRRVEIDGYKARMRKLDTEKLLLLAESTVAITATNPALSLMMIDIQEPAYNTNYLTAIQEVLRERIAQIEERNNARAQSEAPRGDYPGGA